MSYCEAHGAGNEVSKHASERRQVEVELRKTLQVVGYVEPVTDPYTELAQVAGEIRQARTQLAAMVASLPSIEDVGTDKYATQLSVIVSAWKEFLNMSARVSTDMAKLDLTERIAKLHASIDRATAELVQTALARALGKSDMTQETRNAVLKNFGEALRVKDAPPRPSLPIPVTDTL